MRFFGKGPKRVHIVVVEDNLSVARGIGFVLQDEGHAVDLIHDGIEADEFLRDCDADLLILDVNLPGQSGLEVLRALRQRGDRRPVLLLTAQSQTQQKIEGLDAGADDYLVKPFDMAELSARIRALARRKQQTNSSLISLGTLTYDRSTRALWGADGRAIDLPRREMSVIEALLLAQGRTVSKQALLDRVYGTGADIDEQVIEVYISRLRKRLAGEAVQIRMKRGLGYLIQSDPA